MSPNGKWRENISPKVEHIFKSELNVFVTLIYSFIIGEIFLTFHFLLNLRFRDIIINLFVESISSIFFLT